MMKNTVARVGMTFVACVALVLFAATLSGCGGVGTVSKSVADRVLPTQQLTVYAYCPDPASYDDSYADASGTGTNYVYDVDAATEKGDRITVTLILFGRQASGEGWLEIEAKGTSGVYYQSVDEAEVPRGALDTLSAR